MELPNLPDHEALARNVDVCRRLMLRALDRRRGEPSAPGGEIDAFLDLAGPAPGPLAPPRPARLPACRHLEDALALGRDGPEEGIARAICAIAPALRWTYSYPDDPRWPELASRVAFTQLLGPKGLLPDDRLLLGLTLVAPATIYPRHVHPAIEFYLVIAGTALWQAGEETVLRPPGSLIFHPSGIPHAMTTTTDPLLAVFTWHGDIMSPSIYQI
jgi:quercetin dioxygenase-like cupin family protein